MRNSYPTMLATLMAVVLAAPCHAEEDANKTNREKLRGIKEFAVFVFTESEVGLDLTGLQTAAEAALRKARLPLVATKELVNIATAPSQPILNIDITAIPVERTGMVALTIDYRLTEIIVPFRQPMTKIVGTTWRRIAVGTVGAKNLNDVRRMMVEQLDMFINDYLTENATH